MRSRRIWARKIAAAVLAASAVAFTVRAGDAPPPALSRLAAQSYANEMHQFVQQVRGQYVREIAEEDLFFAGLSGLYEAAGVPVPGSLRDELTAQHLRWLQPW